LLGVHGGCYGVSFRAYRYRIDPTNRQYLQRTLKPDGSSIDGVTDAAGLCICTTDYTTFALKLDPGSDLQTVKKQMVGTFQWGTF